jgi:hypothetical protein
VKLALATRIGNGAKLLDAQLDFHLAAGVDVIVVESDGAFVVPERFANAGTIELVHGSAREAAEELGADWVIESRPDEFWWPRGGTLKELLELVSPTYGSVQALPRRFVPVTAAGPVADRMIYRFAQQPAERRFVRRAGRRGEELSPIRGWYPIEVLRLSADDLGQYDEEALRLGVDRGLLTVDTRLRDALRTIGEGRPPGFERVGVAEEARFATDLAALRDAELADTRTRLNALELRLAAVEAGLLESVKRRLRSRWKRA